jgi:hypothetical protein
MARRNSSTSSGLVRYASAPAARSRSSDAGVASALTTTIGIAAVRGSARRPAQHLVARDVGQVQVEQHHVGQVLARELDAELPLQRRHRAPRRARQQDRLDEAQVRQVVLDVQQRRLPVRRGRRRGHDRVLEHPHRILCSGEIDAEDATSGPTRLEQEPSAHRLAQPLRQREPEPRALDLGLLGARAARTA